MTIHNQRIATRPSHGHTISLFSSQRRSRYNLSRLHKQLALKVHALDIFNRCHLTAYPYIAVHVTNRSAEYLTKNYELIKSTIESTLWEMIE